MEGNDDVVDVVVSIVLLEDVVMVELDSVDADEEVFEEDMLKA